MLDIKWVRKNPTIVREMLQWRSHDFDLESLLQVDQEVLDNQKLYDTKQHYKSNLETSIQGNGITEELRGELLKLKEEIQCISHNLKELKDKRTQMLLKCPNILDSRVPYGKTSQENVLIKQWVSPRDSLNSNPIMQENALNVELMDNIRNACGSRFIGLSNKIARLHRAIGQFCLDSLGELEYTEMLLPSLLNIKGITNSGQYPVFDNDLFWTNNKDYALIPTSEVIIANLFQNNIIDLKKLPLKYMCYSPCFRKEAGAAGKDTKGLIRLHQFHKVEIFQFATMDQSDESHKSMVSTIENILQKLGLTYRVMLLCSGDTGFHSAMTYDTEVWMPGQNKFVEISSCSNVRTFQTNRTITETYNYETSYKEKLATLNGSCLPIERTLSAIIENYSHNGTIFVPDVLIPYTGFTTINEDEINTICYN